jgi:hypothetical protein
MGLTFATANGLECPEGGGPFRSYQIIESPFAPDFVLARGYIDRLASSFLILQGTSHQSMGRSGDFNSTDFESGGQGFEPLPARQ